MESEKKLRNKTPTKLCSFYGGSAIINEIPQKQIMEENQKALEFEVLLNQSRTENALILQTNFQRNKNTLTYSDVHPIFMTTMNCNLGHLLISRKRYQKTLKNGKSCENSMTDENVMIIAFLIRRRLEKENI